MISCEMYAVFSLLIRKAQKYPVLFPYHPDKNIIAYSALIYNERWMYQILLRFLSGKRSIKCGFQSKKLDKSSNKPLFIGFSSMISNLALLFGGGEEILYFVFFQVFLYSFAYIHTYSSLYIITYLHLSSVVNYYNRNFCVHLWYDFIEVIVCKECIKNISK